ncbi:MAG: OmpA family protein [Bacteroidetes bacterium]|nr:OmpA family protein [Bacteroidota bacterium]
MKNTVFSIISTTTLLGLALTGCGPSDELLSSRARVDRLQQDSVNTHVLLNDCNMTGKNLRQEKASVQTDLNVLTSESKMTIADQAKRLKTMQDIIQSQKDVMGRLKTSIADALLNYKTDELNVYIKEGAVYVSLEEKLLFKSGSDVIDPKGKEALKTLAAVLKSTKDITVMIEGHTDNVPIKTGKFKDNWDLSTSRATSIVRILTTDFGFDSNRITASGKGQFHPVKSNESADGRSGNRRTEIILTPDMKELYNLFYL